MGGTQSGEPSENSEPTIQVFFRCHVGRPLIFESQYSESSNLGTQSQELSENSETTTQDPNVASPLKFESQYSESYWTHYTENADETTKNVDESTEYASVSSDTVIFETSDFNTNTDLVS